MEIKISRAAHVCAATGRPFVHEEELYSVVRMAEGALVREDFSKDGWSEERGKGAYCVWATKFYDPQAASQLPPEVFSPLRQLFYEAVESEDRTERAKAFLAAQLLRRQKAFRLVKESDEGDGEARLYLYADRIGNRLIEVRDPNFTYGELDTARNLLLSRLEALEAPVDPAPEPAAAGMVQES